MLRDKLINKWGKNVFLNTLCWNVSCIITYFVELKKFEKILFIGQVT